MEPGKLRPAISLLLLIIPGIITADNCPPEKHVVACYYASWSIYRPDNGTYKIDYINPKLCTHLIYSFAGLNLKGDIDSLDFYNDVTMAGYKSFNEIKEENPCVKTLLAIGGWNEGSEKYSLMAENEETRKEFAEGVLRFLCYFGFDGLDVDWEYPTQRGGIGVDKENFNELLRTLKDTFSTRQKILTVAIAVPPAIVNAAYNVPELCDIVDLVFVMAYDLQDPTRISVHAPLKREANDAANRVTIDDGINNLLKLQCPAEKIVLGIGGFGKSFTMRSPSNHLVGDVAAAVGKPGPYLQAPGSLGFNEICEAFRLGNWTTKQLANNAMSYAYKDKQWVSYDDEKSIGIKAAYALQLKLRGLMLYSIDTDDYHGDCVGHSYPLLNAMNKGLKRSVEK